MKKMRTLISCMALMSLLLSLCACGGAPAKDDPTLGIYKGLACGAFGYYGEISEIYDGECQVELKKNGKCVVTLEGEDLDGEYTLEGETINIVIEGGNSPGTLKDGILSFDFMETGAELFFVKDGAVIPDFLQNLGETSDPLGGDIAEPSEDGTIIYQDAKAVYLRSEIVEDYNGADTIAVYFDFTNNGTKEDSFGWAYYYAITQGDTELESTSVFPDNDSPELADDVYTDIAPGESIEICLTYLLTDLETPVTITFTDMMDNVIGLVTIELSA